MRTNTAYTEKWFWWKSYADFIFDIWGKKKKHLPLCAFHYTQLQLATKFLDKCVSSHARMYGIGYYLLVIVCIWTLWKKKNWESVWHAHYFANAECIWIGCNRLDVSFELLFVFAVYFITFKMEFDAFIAYIGCLYCRLQSLYTHQTQPQEKIPFPTFSSWLICSSFRSSSLLSFLFVCCRSAVAIAIISSLQFIPVFPFALEFDQCH